MVDLPGWSTWSDQGGFDSSPCDTRAAAWQLLCSTIFTASRWFHGNFELLVLSFGNTQSTKPLPQLPMMHLSHLQRRQRLPMLHHFLITLCQLRSSAVQAVSPRSLDSQSSGLPRSSRCEVLRAEGFQRLPKRVFRASQSLSKQLLNVVHLVLLTFTKRGSSSASHQEHKSPQPPLASLSVAVTSCYHAARRFLR